MTAPLPPASGSERWLVVVDHQTVFADRSSAWAAPRFAEEHSERVVLTRWVPAQGAQRVGSWVDYFQAWPFADQPPSDALFDLVPSALALDAAQVLTRHTFGKWGPELEDITGPAPELTLVGVSTDCCVLSTALAAADAGAAVRVVAAGCAGSTDKNHTRALDVMRLYSPQIEVV